MALQASEEETIENLKTWWDESGKRLVLIAIAVLAAYTSWLLLQNSRIATLEVASDLYEEVLRNAVLEPGTVPDEGQSLRIIELSAQLKEEHNASIYAQFASLFSAQQLVRNGDLDGAENALQWVLDNQKDGLFSTRDEGLVLTASLRLGRVILAKGEAERALTLVNGVDPKTFESGFAELRGDIYVVMDRFIDAREAYIAAQQSGSVSDALRMKLDDLSDES